LVISDDEKNENVLRASLSWTSFNKAEGKNDFISVAKLLFETSDKNKRKISGKA